MINYSWKLLKIHATDYNGKCVYCGGNCKCNEAIAMRVELYDEMRDFSKKLILSADEKRRLKYLIMCEKYTHNYVLN